LMIVTLRRVRPFDPVQFFLGHYHLRQINAIPANVKYLSAGGRGGITS
jgi:hypothetical protein